MKSIKNISFDWGALHYFLIIIITMESERDVNCDLSEHHSQIIINFVTLLKLTWDFFLKKKTKMEWFEET